MRLYGFIYREISLKKEAIGGFISQFLTPLMYFLFFAFSLSRTVNFEYHGKTISYLLYVLPGIIAIQIFYSYPVVSSTTFNDVRFGIIRTSLLGGGTLSGYILAKILVESSVVILVSLFLVLIGILFINLSISLATLFQFIIYLIISTMFWISVGIVTGVKIRGELTRNMIFALLNLPIIFTSPVFYLEGSAPAWIQILGKINPLTYHVVGLRGILLLGNISLAFWAVSIVLGISLVILSIKLASEVAPK
ncbi:ABC transporter permease [Thermococcus sp.]